jgi:hypothetical protein
MSKTQHGSRHRVEEYIDITEQYSKLIQSCFIFHCVIGRKVACIMSQSVLFKTLPGQPGMMCTMLRFTNVFHSQ